MQDTAKYLCENVQGAVMAYVQSDEISLLLIDYQTLNSQAFFDYEVQKICSITASMATFAFNKAIASNATKYFESYAREHKLIYLPEDMEKYCNTIQKSINKGAMFDSRCFNLPIPECTNYFYWRQLDATRNSIQMVGQANFSHKELQNKSCNDIQDMLYEQKGINWNDIPTHKKRGSCCIKTKQLVNGIERSRWIVDNEIPVFVNEGRNYIEKLIE